MNDVGMVMPVYNQEPKYLRLSIISVLQQTYKNFYLVIVIDGANALTRNIIYQFKNDPRIIIIDNKVNQGISNALNKGFDYLSQLNEVQFLTWGSSDNIVYPHFIEKLRKKLKDAPPDVGLVYSSFHHINARGKIMHNNIQQLNIRKWQQNKVINDLLDSSFIGTSFMYKKAFAERIGGYYLDPVQTYDYWLRLTEICNIEFIPEELMGYRLNSRLSLSKEILFNIDKHRWWRNQFNIARHMARKRRKIAYETTIIFPVQNNDVTIKEIENILEQQYHNYQLIFIDKTKQIQPKLKNTGVKDPRITVIEVSDAEFSNLDKTYKPMTPLKLVYSKNINLTNVHSLSNIINQMKTV
ncbi:hypothetical protein ABE41_008700 [Fictibacillus arsenicus]|uniref:Glycosyltransferase 2-like domain-containing protein n=1 Tax=Fictibacillus arsenicus TaxID=255247 RepID=A0A1B1Z3U7_9BACL|nr:glycosyltransferase family 2 protein [Fictibacillus arsenicus]ANX12084.1 hypothetical protein ABE41_008700 [Fictibacillus arsenicus]